jgi:hypothetical protein
MKGHMTKSEGRAFKARWAAVNLAEQRELQTTSIDQKARQLAALMESVEALGWTEALASEETEVRERWNELRKICRK